MNEKLIVVDTSVPDVVILIINRPEKRNALSLRLMRDLIDAIHLHEKTCKALVIAANGLVFCAGLDLEEASNPNLAENTSKTIAELYSAIYLAPCVTLCAIQGDALAGGIGLMMAADFVLMAKDASLWFPEVKKGIIPALVAVMLRKQIAMRHIRELLIFGNKVNADKALSIGVINQVVFAGNVFDETVACAQSVAQSSPTAIQSLKKLLIDLEPSSLQTDLAKALKAKGTLA